MDFPPNPAPGDECIADNGAAYCWDGVKWGHAAAPQTHPYLPLSGGVLSGPLFVSVAQDLRDTTTLHFQADGPAEIEGPLQVNGNLNVDQNVEGHWVHARADAQIDADLFVAGNVFGGWLYAQQPLGVHYALGDGHWVAFDFDGTTLRAVIDGSVSYALARGS